MKAKIVVLKAPWPAGAGLGSIVEFAGKAAPAWAVGKFLEQSEDTSADFVYEPPEVCLGRDAPAPQTSQDALVAQAAQHFRQQAFDRLQEVEAQHAGVVAQFRADLESGGLALQEALTKTSALEAENADLKAKLEAAQAQAEAPPASASREALDAEAKALGLSFNSRTSDETLAQRIAEAKVGK